MLQQTSSYDPQHQTPVVVTPSLEAATPRVFVFAPWFTPPSAQRLCAGFPSTFPISKSTSSSSYPSQRHHFDVRQTHLHTYSSHLRVSQLVFSPSGAAWEATMGSLLSQLTLAVRTSNGVPAAAGAGLHASYLAALKFPASSVGVC